MYACEKHKAPTEQPPKPQDTDISRYKALHQGMQALQAEKRWGVDSILIFMGTHNLVCEYFSKEAWRVRCNKKKAKNNSAHRCKTRKT
jgi:hypothetical protein